MDTREKKRQKIQAIKTDIDMSICSDDLDKFTNKHVDKLSEFINDLYIMVSLLCDEDLV
jgi:hypothetical protein